MANCYYHPHGRFLLPCFCFHSSNIIFATVYCHFRLRSCFVRCCCLTNSCTRLGCRCSNAIFFGVGLLAVMIISVIGKFFLVAFRVVIVVINVVSFCKFPLPTKLSVFSKASRQLIVLLEVHWSTFGKLNEEFYSLQYFSNSRCSALNELLYLHSMLFGGPSCGYHVKF